MAEEVIIEKQKLLMELHDVMEQLYKVTSESKSIISKFDSLEKNSLKLIGKMIKTMDVYGSDEKK